MRPIRILSATAATTQATLPPQPIPQPLSPWHSPVPYLFGGLAAMLGLIAFALLILACSYWRLSGRLVDSEGGGDHQRDLESSNEKEGDAAGKAGKVYEEKFLVIMAGDQKPTFLATPVSSRSSSFVDQNAKVENREEENAENNRHKMKGEIGDNNETSAAAEGEEERNNGENQETQQSQMEENH